MRYFACLIFVLSAMTARAQGIAVVELFTSQGCSSCPSADKNLTEMLQQAGHDGTQVIGLSFHVDYWNSLGWKDPYSNKAFTIRQQTYGDHLNLSTIYTPQMIVNGQFEFVGSDRSKSKELTKRVLGEKPAYRIDISNLSLSDQKLSLQYTLDKSPGGEMLNIAIVEKDLENVVPRGENSGKKLHHDNVVRLFMTIPIKREGSIQVPIPDIDVTKSAVVLYVQDTEWHITGAAIKNIQAPNR